jgi:DNA gyrase subunit A
MAGLEDDIIVIASGGTVIRMPVRDISSQGRDATGVRVMNLDEDTRVVAAARAPVSDDDEDEAEDGADGPEAVDGQPGDETGG